METACTLHILIGQLKRILPPDSFELIYDISYPSRYCTGCNQKKRDCENVPCIIIDNDGEEDYTDVILCEQCRYISLTYFCDVFLSYDIGGEIRWKLSILEEEKEENDMQCYAPSSH